MRDYEINSDLKQSKFENLKFVQGDTGSKIIVNLFEDSQTVNLSNCTVLAKYKRSDGYTDNKEATITDNTITVEVDETMTTTAGVLKLIFEITYETTKKVSTFMLLADISEGIGSKSTTGGGTGDVVVDVDLSNYYNKQEIDKKLDNIANEVKAINIPTKTSELTNDSGFLTEHQDISGKVDKVEGKGLSTNDYTNTDKQKLDLINENYFILKSPNGTQYKIKVTDSGAIKVIGINEVELEDLLENRLLVWHDEFDGETLDTTKWRYATLNSGGSEQQAYTIGRRENVRLENSNLIIQALKDGYVDGWTWSSGKLETYGLAGFKYGRLEAKLKYDVVSGAFPAFWGLGTCAYYPAGENIHGVQKSKGTQWASNGELDMFEGRGTNTTIGQGGWYNQDDGIGNLSMEFGSKVVDASEYHIYAIEWTENTITSYIDGVATGEPKDISNIKSWHRPMFLKLNMAVGSTGGVPADDCTDIKMYVDWVRVYAPVEVTEKIDVESITLTQTELTFNIGDDPIDVYYTVNPSTAWDNNVNYESSDTEVATVYGSRIYPIGVGNCTITARATNGVTATINVTVAENTDINSTSITLDKSTLEVYEDTSSTLIATATPDNHTDTILWKSSDVSIATVNSSGVVTGIKAGSCIITAYSSVDETIKAECSVTIKQVVKLTGHPTDGLTLQLDRNGMSSTAWKNSIDNVSLPWISAYDKSTDISSYMVFDGESFCWNGANYKDHLTLDGFSNYYDFGKSQTVILAGDFTECANPILSNKSSSSQKAYLATMQNNAVSYTDVDGNRLGIISNNTNLKINGCISLRYNKETLRVDLDKMPFTDSTLTNQNVTLTGAFIQGNYKALLGNSSTAKAYYKLVLVYNRVLTNDEVQTAMTAIKTFLNTTV